VDSVTGCAWNGWPDHRGMTGRMGVEYTPDGVGPPKAELPILDEDYWTALEILTEEVGSIKECTAQRVPWYPADPGQFDWAMRSFKLWLKNIGFNSTDYGILFLSSTSYISDPSYAWSVGLSEIFGHYKLDHHPENRYFAVRGGQKSSIDLNFPANISRTGQLTCYDSNGVQHPCLNTGEDGDIQMGIIWPNPRFEPYGDCVIDKLTGLFWPKNANMFNNLQTWQTSLDKVKNLTFCGFTDWRIPNVQELISLVDYSKVTPAIPDGNFFYNILQGNCSIGYCYWTSTTKMSATQNAYVVSFGSGSVSYNNKSNLGIIWPVRGGIKSPLGEPNFSVMGLSSLSPNLSNNGWYELTNIRNRPKYRFVSGKLFNNKLFGGTHNKGGIFTYNFNRELFKSEDLDQNEINNRESVLDLIFLKGTYLP